MKKDEIYNIRCDQIIHETVSHNSIDFHQTIEEDELEDLSKYMKEKIIHI
jgi:hypothetical protein